MNINILLPIKFDQAFTYLCDISLNLEQGDYVLVPFRNKEIVGIDLMQLAKKIADQSFPQ